MKIAATASYSAVPSMFIVAPIGITNRATLESTSFFSSRQFIEIGRVALLKYKQSLQQSLNTYGMEQFGTNSKTGDLCSVCAKFDS
jgi:hypothetical protein